MANLMKGAEVNAALNEKIMGQVEMLKAKGIAPQLGIVRVGEREDDLSYERGASKRCEKLGVAVKKYVLPADASQEDLLAVIDEVNKDETVHGVLMFRPLPKHMDEKLVCRALDPAKDVDGITDGSMVGVYSGQKMGFAPCTPSACMKILEHYNIETVGKKAVVIGRSMVVGKPAAMMLLQKNATVTVCHTKTVDMPAVAREADILIVAAGRPEMIGASYLRDGQTVIDVGIHMKEDGKLCGDVKFDEAEPMDIRITPVPGGVGTVTTTVLVGNVVEAAMRQAGIDA